jgi:DNA polymerase elongation subunit (family B)/predicted RNA-binding Zn-ribbon protein involved in translation (DUF1610 family)
MSVRKPRILLWDIEASNLVADYGWVLCIAYKWFDEPGVKLLRLRDCEKFKSGKDRTADGEMLKKFIAVMEQADVHVFWFGEYFDLPFVTTRLAKIGIYDLPPVPFIDGWRISRKKLKLRSNRLDAVAKIVPKKPGQRKPEKLQPEPEHWCRANAGHIDALKVIEERCVSDVLVLEQNYEFLRPLATNLPNLSKLEGKREEGCPACGGERIQSRGYALTARGQHRRYQCQGCAHWFKLPVKVKVG